MTASDIVIPEQPRLPSGNQAHMTPPVLAWRTTLWGIDSVVFASTRAKAKAATIRAAQDAGYRASFVSPVRCVRAPEADGLCVESKVLSPDYVTQALGGLASSGLARGTP